MTLRSLMTCEWNRSRAQLRDALVGAAVMIVTAMIMKALATTTQQGFPTTSRVLKDLSFVGPFTLSMPFWLMRDQSWKAQAAIVGGTLAILIALGYLA